MKQGPKRDITGQVFNQLTVTGYSHATPRGARVWDCVCSCGNPHKASTASLEHGNVKSCGCRRRQPRIALGMLSTDGLVKQLLGHYKQGAQRRNLLFSITKPEFEILIGQNCFYCGQTPNQSYRPTRYQSDLRYTGIDRVDNSIGYVLDNCVPCCKRCNQFKSSMTQDQMFAVVGRIYRNHSSRCEEPSK